MSIIKPSGSAVVNGCIGDSSGVTLVPAESLVKYCGAAMVEAALVVVSLLV